MNPVIAIAIVAVVALAIVALFAASRRRDTGAATGAISRETVQRDRGRISVEGSSSSGTPAQGKAYERSVALERLGGGAIEPVKSSAPVVFVPPDPETIGVSRRQFLNRSIVGAMGLSVTTFGVSIIAMLWPNASGGFGSRLNVGNVDDVKARVRASSGFLYVPEGRMWVTEYPVDKVDKASAVYKEPVLVGMRAGLIALWQTCPHLGCRVPECKTSQWFECPCHGSKYNRVGEKRAGPAPRGMDAFGVEIDGNNNFLVNTGNLLQGAAIGTNTTGQEAEGPACIGQAAAH